MMFSIPELHQNAKIMKKHPNQVELCCVIVTYSVLNSFGELIKMKGKNLFDI